MIFVTTGTQIPFDRLIKIIDKIAPSLDEEIIAQVNNGSYTPKHIKTVQFLTPTEFNQCFNKARLIIAHAGMGTIISAMVNNKPIIIMPRNAELKEHRNNHQIATAKKMAELGYVNVAYNEDELKRLLLNTELLPLYQLSEYASEQLTNTIRDFIEQ